MAKGVYVVQAYKAKDGFRWRMRAPNGKIVADGSEAYTTKAGVNKAVLRVGDCRVLKVVPLP